MTQPIDMKDARALVRDERRWPLVREFLFGFASLADAARVDAACGDGTAARRGSPRVDAFVCERLGVTPLFHAFPAEDGSRLLLLAAESYQNIGLWLAALARADELRNVISGARVRELKAALPGVYPDVLKIVPYFHKWQLPAADGDDFAVNGLRYLATALKDLPVELLGRQRLRFPVEREGGFTPLDGGVSLEEVFRLMQIQFPKEYALCCS